MSFKRIIVIAGLSTTLAGCNTIGSDDPGFGEAARYNAAIQTINPMPVYSLNSAQPGSNGDKGAQAVKRYRSDAVKPVETMQTTSGSSGSSGSSTGSTPQ